MQQRQPVESPPRIPADGFGGTSDIEIEGIEADQEIMHLGGDGLRQPRQPLRRQHTGKAALPAPAHQVGDCGDRRLSHRTGRRRLSAERREQMRLVDGDQHRMPMLSRALDQGAQEGRHGDHLPFAAHLRQVEHQRQAVLAYPPRQQSHCGGIQHRTIHMQMPQLVSQRPELALRIDDDLLDHPRAAFQQPAHRPALAGAGNALDQQPPVDQLRQVKPDRPADLPIADRNFLRSRRGGAGHQCCRRHRCRGQSLHWPCAVIALSGHRRREGGIGIVT